MKITFGIFQILLLTFLSSCTGYRFTNSLNPLEEDGVRSISVPMFINRSSLPNASAPFTQEMVHMLAKYPGLEIFNGENLRADAIMIGVITSDKKLRDVYETMTRIFTDGDLQTSIGNRPQFYIPTSTQYKLNVKVMIIKNPSKKDMKLFQSEMGDHILKHPKVIVNHSTGLVGSFTRETKAVTDPDDGGVVNQSKTDYYFEQSLLSLAKSNAESFRQVVLDVF